MQYPSKHTYLARIGRTLIQDPRLWLLFFSAALIGLGAVSELLRQATEIPLVLP